MKYCFTFLALLSITSILSAQPECTIISNERLGGNNGALINEQSPKVVKNSDGSFSICIVSGVTEGNLLSGCAPEGTINGGGVFVHYDANYAAQLGQSCAPYGAGFEFPSFYVYPQLNGDSIIIGWTGSDLYGRDYAIERRNGNIIWDKHYGGTGTEWKVMVAPSADGGFFIAGETYSNNGDVGIHYGDAFTPDLWVIRVDNNGDTLWAKVIGGAGYENIGNIIATGDGGCYVFASTSSTDHDGEGNHGASDVLVVRLDSAGNELWHQCLGGSGIEAYFQNSVYVTKDNGSGFYILTSTNSHDGDVQARQPDGLDYWLLHIDSAANILWEHTYGGPLYDYPCGLCRATDGSLWMTGFYETDSTGGYRSRTYGQNDTWVCHADSNGAFINQVSLGAANTRDVAQMIWPLQDGSVLTGGYSELHVGIIDSTRSNGFPYCYSSGIDIFLVRLGAQSVGVAGIDRASSLLKIFPNPARKEITIQAATDKATLIITDASGRQVYSAPFRQSAYINTSHWIAGSYYATLSVPGKRATAQQFVVW